MQANLKLCHLQWWVWQKINLLEYEAFLKVNAEVPKP